MTDAGKSKTRTRQEKIDEAEAAYQDLRAPIEAAYQAAQRASLGLLRSADRVLIAIRDKRLDEIYRENP
jgi:hypothetical protein